MNKITLDTQCHDEEIVVSSCNDLVVVTVNILDDRHKGFPCVETVASLELSVAEARDLMNALSEAIADAGRDKR